MTQADKARALLQRHLAPPILVLPNAWDAASARVFETAGFPAIATTSAGVAWARGYPDGAFIPPGEMKGVMHGDRLKVQLTAPPVDGAANDALVQLLAKALGRPRAAVAIVRGQTGRKKTVRVAGATRDALLHRIAEEE